MGKEAKGTRKRIKGRGEGRADLVVIGVEVVGCREDGDNGGEPGLVVLTMHPIASVLRLMRSDDREEFVLIEELAGGVEGEGRGAASDLVELEQFLDIRSKVLHGVSPEEVARKE